jgi:membrane protein EpsK
VEGVFGPTILYYHARHDTEGLVRYVCRAIKCTGLMIALPVGLVCGLSAPLLETWLGPGFVELSWLMSLMTFHMCVNQAIRPLFGVQRAMNRVRIPAIATFITGLANLGLALLLAGPAGWGMYGVAAAGAIALTARNVLFTPTYAARILGRKVGSFQRETLPIAIAALLITFACWLLQLVVDLTGWWRLGLVTCPIAALYAIAAYHFLLDAQDRDMLKAMIPRRRIPQ